MTVKEQAQDALFAAVEKLATELKGSTGTLGGRAKVAADLALAYRYAAGGAQPGSVNVEK